MQMTSVSARFDGERVQFDESIALKPNTRLLVTILEDTDQERDDFLQLASTSFADTFDDEEVEYTPADLKR